MPEGTRVDTVYKALLAKGHSPESAARIAQSVTGEALATGKPPKHEHENCSDIENNGTGLENSEPYKSGVLRGNEYLRARLAALGVK